MSGPPEWLKDVFPRPQPTPPGPIARARELEPVTRPKKEPRAPLARQSAKGKEKRKRQFGEQAARCRKAPCACCGAKGRSEPNHWPTRANGGLDADTMPLCGGPGGCHEAFHAAGSPEAFLERTGCDVIAAIQAMRRKPDHSCERFAELRENGTPGRERSEYVCSRCGYVIPTDGEAE